MTPLERLLLRAGAATVAGAAAALPLLVMPQPSADPLAASTLHLAMVVSYGLLLAILWAPGNGLVGCKAGLATAMASGAVVVAVNTWVVALVTLATGAALRFDSSLQFLQLLSALDIAWAGAAIVVGGVRWHGRLVGTLLGIGLGVVCVWAIWHYLDVVGFTPSGGWVVDAGALWTYVLPYDMGAAAAAVAVLVVGTWSSQRTVQPSPKS